MRYRAWDAKGDYTFGNGGNNFLVNSPECVAQAIVSRYRLQLGEWFVDTSDGTPWMTQVLGAGTAGTRDLALQERALGTMNVTSISNCQSSFVHGTRVFTASLIAETAFGSTPVVTADSTSKPAEYLSPPVPFANLTVPAPTPSPV